MSIYQTRLKAMTASASEPTLTNTEIDALLTQYSVEDADGLAPSDEDWTPTYNMRAAAAEGWRWKAGRCANLVSADLDGDRLSSNQIYDHCLAMVKQYAGAASPSIGQGTDDDSFFN